MALLTPTRPAASAPHNDTHPGDTHAGDTHPELPPGGSPPSRWRSQPLAVGGLLALTAVLYLWNLSASGYGNSFYAAAVQAGTQSWKAFFFGSLDSANAITVDKPPASLWIMELSGRIFGFSSWSLLAPQALEGVAAVGLLYLAVKRISGHGAGLLAGAALAVTPAAVLMFRFDNPDALLTLLLVAAGYAMIRALETASTRWMLAVGTLLGFGFLTKMGQAFLIVPALGLAYLICAPTSFRRRIVQLLLGGAAIVVSAGWYVLAVALTPAADRPFIAGSGNNSVLGLALGYNGLGRLFGGSGNGGGGGGSSAAGTSFGGATGVSRLFSNEFGLEVSWLLPASIIGLVAGLWMTRRSARTNLVRAGLIVWGGWLICTGVVLSYMQGTVHPYYTVALAPGIAATVAISARQLWARRESIVARITLGVMVAVTAFWTEHLLGLDATWFPALRYVIAVAAAVMVGALLAYNHSPRRLGAVLAITAVLAGGAGTTAWATATAGQAHTGSIPSTGPASSSTGGMGGFGGSTRTGGAAAGGTPPTGTRPTETAPTGTAPTGTTPTGGGAGDSTSSALTTLLAGTTTKWAAATIGATSAASYELASSKAVIAIGGWNGSDNAPTLAQFEAMVKAGEIHYLVAGGQGGGQGGSGGTSSATAITAWVVAHYTSTTVGGSTVYDLTTATK